MNFKRSEEDDEYDDEGSSSVSDNPRPSEMVSARDGSKASQNRTEKDKNAALAGRNSFLRRLEDQKEQSNTFDVANTTSGVPNNSSALPLIGVNPRDNQTFERKPDQMMGVTTLNPFGQDNEDTIGVASSNANSSY